jgi:hypothetical protein
MAITSIPAPPSNDVPATDFSLHLTITESSLQLLIIRLIAAIHACHACRKRRPWCLRAQADTASLFALPVGLALFKKSFDRLFRITAANTESLQRRFFGNRIP